MNTSTEAPLRNEGMLGTRALLCLCLDTSAALKGEPLRDLEAQVHRLLTALASNPLTRDGVDLAIVTFGRRCDVLVPHGEPLTTEGLRLTAAGRGRIFEGVRVALELMVARLADYRSMKSRCVLEKLIVLTHGSGVDGEGEVPLRALLAAEGAPIDIAAFAVGPDADLSALRGVLNLRETPSIAELDVEAFTSELAARIGASLH